MINKTINTLTKFGVPLDVDEGRGGILQPKQQYRFRVRFLNFGPITGGLELTQQVISFNKPSISFEETTMDSYNSRAYVHGKHSWQTASLSVRDDVANSAATLVGHQIQKQLNHFEQTAFKAGVNYKFYMVYETLDGGNDGVIERWDYEGCWLSNVDYGSVDYSSSNYQTINLTIRFDNATQQEGIMPEGKGSGGTNDGGLGFASVNDAVYSG